MSLYGYTDSLLSSAEWVRNGDPASLSELPVARTLCQLSEVKIFMSSVAFVNLPAHLIKTLTPLLGTAELSELYGSDIGLLLHGGRTKEYSLSAG